jgi:hypothetical protein
VEAALIGELAQAGAEINKNMTNVVQSFISFLKGKDDNYVQRDKQRAGARSTSTTTRTIVLAIVVIFIAIVFWQLAKK